VSEQELPTNVAGYLPGMAEKLPDQTAIYLATSGKDADGKKKYLEISYSELNDRSEHIALGLLELGLEKGTRTVLMVKPSPELFALTFGMFKAGIPPVMVDPGIGMKNLKACLHKAEPEAFIGVTPAHAARIALGWPKVKHKVTVGRRLLWGGSTLEQVEEIGKQAAARGERLPDVEPDDLAAILFTSGSTGPPKGVEYRHRMMVAQVEAIRSSMNIEPGEVDLPTFPLFALFDPALGMTTVIPEMDFTKPASVDPENILGPIERFNVTTMFGSPGLLNPVGREGEKRGAKFPKLKRVFSAGAPLPGETARRWLDMLEDDGNVFPGYGCTEALPISWMDARSIIADTWPETEKGAGVCVGKPVPGLAVKLIRVDDTPIAEWSDDLEVKPGEIGEVCIKGPQVTEVYFNDDENTALHKMREGHGIWHRVGDLGWRDDQGRVWFCGRKSQRVKTNEGDLYTVAVEKSFDAHPLVFRSALVGPIVGGDLSPTLVVELEEGADPEQVLRELEAMKGKNEYAHADTARVERFLIHDGLPVDIRHNAKINREQLRVWAEQQLARGKAA
jgi:acyl-CoA synthetase (AMP-forming)/AMP-acid ligase II